MMQTAFILMTILGCDDSATDCHHIATLDKRWSSVQLCDAVSEKQLGAYSNANYPVVIAVCQAPEIVAAAPAPSPDVTQAAAPIEEASSNERDGTMAQRAMDRVKSILPSKEGMLRIVNGPVHVVEDGYSWFARRLIR